MARKMSEPVTVAATQAHRQFGDLIRRAFLGKEHFVIEKDGLPVAVILSVSEYADLMYERERLEQNKAARLLQFREAAQTVGSEIEKTGLSEEQVINLLQETKKQVYQSHYGTDPS